MVVGVQVMKGGNSRMIHSFLNADLERTEEADLIEDLNQEHQNNKDYLNGQGQRWLCRF